MGRTRESKRAGEEGRQAEAEGAEGGQRLQVVSTAAYEREDRKVKGDAKRNLTISGRTGAELQCGPCRVLLVLVLFRKQSCTSGVVIGKSGVQPALKRQVLLTNLLVLGGISTGLVCRSDAQLDEASDDPDERVD